MPQTVSSSAVATVGKLNVEPNGVNVIPGKVKLFVDIRDIYEKTRNQLVDVIKNAAQRIANQCNVNVLYEETLRVNLLPIEENLREKLSESVARNGLPVFTLPSGAAHDAMIVGRHLPVAMLFVQSKGGISHSPLEWSSLNDCVKTIHVLKDFLELLDE